MRTIAYFKMESVPTDEFADEQAAFVKKRDEAAERKRAAEADAEKDGPKRKRRRTAATKKR
jgi:hypothetical protein